MEGIGHESERASVEANYDVLARKMGDRSGQYLPLISARKNAREMAMTIISFLDFERAVIVASDAGWGLGEAAHAKDSGQKMAGTAMLMSAKMVASGKRVVMREAGESEGSEDKKGRPNTTVSLCARQMGDYLAAACLGAAYHWAAWTGRSALTLTLARDLRGKQTPV